MKGTPLLRNDFTLYVNDEPVLHTQTFSGGGFEVPTIPIKNGDTEGWEEVVLGRTRKADPIEFTAGQIQPGTEPSTGLTYLDMFRLAESGDASVYWKIGTDVSGAYVTSGYGFLTKVTPGWNGIDEESTYSGTITPTGDVSVNIYTP